MAEGARPARRNGWLNLDIASSVLVLTGTLVLLFLVFPSQISRSGGDGLEALLPTLVCLFIAVLSVIWLASSVRVVMKAGHSDTGKAGSQEAQDVDPWRRKRLLATTAGYAVMISFIGYVIASAILITAFCYILGERSKRVIFLLAVVFPLVVNAFLARVLHIRFTDIDNFLAGLS